jgi:hypothetical protein
LGAGEFCTAKHARQKAVKTLKGVPARVVIPDGSYSSEPLKLDVLIPAANKALSTARSRSTQAGSYLRFQKTFFAPVSLHKLRRMRIDSPRRRTSRDPAASSSLANAPSE